MLVMGPVVHGGWARGDGDRLGDVGFGSKTRQFYREKIELPFFKFHLKDKGKLDAARGLGLRDRHQPVARLRRLAAQRRQTAYALLPCPAASSASNRPRAAD